MRLVAHNERGERIAEWTVTPTLDLPLRIEVRPVPKAARPRWWQRRTVESVALVPGVQIATYRGRHPFVSGEGYYFTLELL